MKHTSVYELRSYHTCRLVRQKTDKSVKGNVSLEKKSHIMVFFYTLYPHPFRMGTKSSSQIFDKGTSPFLQTHF